MHRFLFLISIVNMMLLSCTSGSVQPADPCSEKKWSRDKFLGILNNIDQKSEITDTNVNSLITPLKDGFKIDQGSCTGYTEQVRDAAYKVIGRHRNEIIDKLKEIYCQPIDPGSRDLELIAAIVEEKNAAKKALQYLNVQMVNICE